MLQLYQGRATFSKDLLLTPAALVVRTVVNWLIIGRLRNDDSGWLKNELIFYLRISRYSKVMYFLSRCQNISKLNMEHSVKLEKEVWKKWPSSFTFSRERKFGSFHVVVTLELPLPKLGTNLVTKRRLVRKDWIPYFEWNCDHGKENNTDDDNNDN